MNCHVYLSARKKVKKKIKKKFEKKYHSINLFINRNFFPQKSSETKNPSKNLITAKTKISFSSPYNLDIYTLKITYPIRTFFNSVFLKSANLCCDSHICLPSAKINEQIPKTLV